MHNVNFADNTPGVVASDKNKVETVDNKMQDFSGTNNKVNLPFADGKELTSGQKARNKMYKTNYTNFHEKECDKVKLKSDVDTNNHLNHEYKVDLLEEHHELGKEQ